jgi:N-acetylglucosamine-6-phosphate deacetylase
VRDLIPGFVLTPDGFVRGALHVAGGRVAGVDGRPVTEDEALAAGGPYVLPGFVDLHVHGGGGADLMDGGDAIATIARLHARHGTTALLATTVTATPAELGDALDALRMHATAAIDGGARVLGVHLEGPFINAARLGAQPAHARAGTLDEFRALAARFPIRVVTLAPELAGHVELIAALAAAGAVVQLGHSDASYEQARAAFAAGARGVAHLYNAMSGLHHRAPGVVGAALAHAEYAELIPDLVHVHPGALAVARRAIPKLYAVTDATAASGMPDGAYRLGEQRVTKCLGAVRLPDGTLAGSALTTDVAFRNLRTLGLGLDEISRRMSAYPADYLGLAERGRLVPGAHADVVVLDAAFDVRATYVEGARVAPA